MILKSLSVKAYSLINHSGVLDSAWGRRQFTRAYFFYKHRLDPLYANLTRRHPELFRGGPIIDVGANIGYMASLFAKAAEPQYKVYAFEPEAANFEMLKENVTTGKYRERIVPIQAAVGEQDDLVELRRYPTSHAQHHIITPEFKAALSAEAADLVEVPIVSLDSFIASKQIQPLPCFVKIRVLGYELPVCLGMRHILDNSRNLTVAIAYTPDLLKGLGYEPNDLLNIFESRGFYFYAVNEQGKLLALPDPKAGIAELLTSSSFLVKSQLPLPDPKLKSQAPNNQDYLELLFSRRRLNEQ
jgi:FkbM family methyltransferase